MMSAPSEMELFLGALETAVPDRANFVEQISDPQLRDRVSALLRAHEDLGETEPIALDVRARSADPPNVIGKDVDGYRILGVLGRGGMGVVYEAEQASPRRRVALKTLPFSTATPDGLRRLDREANMLARLSHPGIAHVYGSGHAEALDGLPYVVMECIEGEPLDEFADSRGLDSRARIRLIAEIAAAVGHAHQRGVIHRDLKPGNVLVRSDGSVKVLDFGIARLVDDDGSSLSLQTRTGQVLGTLPYMSPEQVGGDTDAIDVRTDVYALGVMTYELLSGTLPIDVQAMSLASAVRRIVEIEPRPLGSIAPSLRGDVETVIGKAMDKDPARRYASAAEFAADLLRLLSDEPVDARAPSRAYQLRKFVRRNRGVCAGVAGTLLSLTMGLVWALGERAVALDAQAQAESIAATERLRARSMTRTVDLVRDLIAGATPQKNRGTPPTIEALVDQLAVGVDASFADDPHVLGSAHLLLADVMDLRGRYEDATHHFERAREEFGRSSLSGPREAVELHLRGAVVARRESRYDDAIAELERGLKTVHALEIEHILEGRLASALANVLATIRRDLPRAERLARRALELATATGNAALVGDRTLALARVLDAADRHQEAIDAYEKVIGYDREHRPDSQDLAVALQNLGHLRYRTGHDEDAIRLLEESLTVRRRVFRDEPHVEVALAIDNLACVLRDSGRVVDAMKLFDEAEPVFRLAHEKPTAELAICLTERGTALRMSDRTDAAVRDFEEAVQIFAASGEPDTTSHAAALEALAMLRATTGAPRDALPIAERAVDMRRRIHGERHYLVARALEVLGTARAHAGEFDGLDLLGREILELRRLHYGDDHWMTYNAAWMIWIALARRGDHDEAIALIERSVAVMTRAFGAGDGRVRQWLTDLRNTHRLAGHTEAAAAVEARIAALAGQPTKR